jgi:hypothetical protein
VSAGEVSHCGEGSCVASHTNSDSDEDPDEGTTDLGLDVEVDSAISLEKKEKDEYPAMKVIP